MLPNFILGGIQKSGTTLLHNLLSKHPQVVMLKRSMEYAYFDDDQIFKRGFDWYQNLFACLESERRFGKIIGQTSADCAFNPDSVTRIMDVIPNTKLIFVLRHPVERTYSLYWHQYSNGREYYHFEDAISKEDKRIKNSYYHLKHFSYVGRSRYKQQFDNVFSNVPSQNVLLLPFDALTKQTLPTVNKVLEFLEVSTVASLEELDFGVLPRNSARIPTNHSVVVISAYLQKMGLTSLGRRLIYLFRVEQRPPAMSSETRQFLEFELKEDIAFFEAVKSEFIASLTS